MCYAPVQIWMLHLLRYGGVASHVAVPARAQLLKEADSGSNRVGSRRAAATPSGRHEPREPRVPFGPRILEMPIEIQ